MKLNCKPGDLALVVSGQYAGDIVTVNKRSGATHKFNTLAGSILFWIDPAPEHPGWICSAASGCSFTMIGKCAHQTLQVPIGDERLRPIRPDEGDDETLTWAGKPEKVTE